MSFDPHYEPQTWVDNETIVTAARMQHIESGIMANDTKCDVLKASDEMLAESIRDMEVETDEIKADLSELPFEGYLPVKDETRHYYDLTPTTKQYANSTKAVVTLDTLSGYKVALVEVSEGEKIHVSTYWHQNIKAVVFTDDNMNRISMLPTTTASHLLFDDDVIVPSGATRMYINGETVSGRDIMSAYRDIQSDTVTYKIQEDYFKSKLGIKGTNELVTVIRNNDDVQIRGRIRGYDGQIACNLIVNGSNNRGMTFKDYTMLSNGVADDVIAVGTMYKDASDDVCPFKYNGSYRAGNHGFALAHKVVCNAHGKTEVDIGSVWTSNSREYVLIKIEDVNTLIFCYRTSFVNPTTSFVHVSGATHTSDIVIGSVATTQILPNCKNVSTEVIMKNGARLDSNGNAKDGYVDVIDRGITISVVTMNNYLIANVGHNTNSSYYDEQIDGEIMYEYTYRFYPNMACLVSCNIIPLVPINKFEFAGIVQAQTIGSTMYVPFTNADTMQTITADNRIFTPSMWKDSEFPPYKFYEFGTNNRGFALGYIIDYKQGLPSERKTRLIDSGNFNLTTKKMYPNFVYNNENIGMKPISAYAFRSPVILSDNYTSVWYEVGDSRYFEIEVFGAFSGYIQLDGTIAKKIELIKSDTALNLIDISNGGIYIDTSTHCSLTLKCY